MDIKKQASIICLLIGLLFASFISQSSALLVWDEDFENPPFDWFLHNYNYTGTWINTPNNFPPIIANGALHMSTPSEMLASAIHNSTIAYGSWSFDFHISFDQIQESVSRIMFIGNNYGGGDLNLTGKAYSWANNQPSSYVIYITSGTDMWGLTFNTITLKIWKPGYPTHIWETLADYMFSSPIIGSHNMTITRNSTQGEFHVYLDSEHLFQVSNNEINTSEIFEFASYIGDISFDNLTVNDETTTNTTTTTTPTTTTITTIHTSSTTTSTAIPTSNPTKIEFGIVILGFIISLLFIRKRKR